MATSELDSTRKGRCHSCNQDADLYLKLGVTEVGGHRIPYTFWQHPECGHIQDISFRGLPDGVQPSQVRAQIFGELNKYSSYYLTKRRVVA